MLKKVSCVWAVSVLTFFFMMPTTWADPCGMVPPIYTGRGVPIKRVGPQKTYVFYKNGFESIVLRPGFSGKVEHFGMLIPFPTPPAIRKMPDNIFSHIGAAIDPPEVRVYVGPRRYRMNRGARTKTSKKMTKPSSGGLRLESVRVLRQEAVGMYEVAVLQAGSPKALKKWMGRHGYRYPKGMDKVTADYIKASWCFVAVKTRVAGKKSVRPRPGMRSAKARYPSGATFTGAVQAMGFRFRSRRLVVPMRLSAFNAGRLRNIVYILAKNPVRIRSINKKFVVRQIKGRRLFKNLTNLLPMRLIRGRLADIKSHRWPSIQARRSPNRYNGLAKELFASDLEAVRRRKLSLAHEERKKALLRIGERLKLRGNQIDRLHLQALKVEHEYTIRGYLSRLKGMTLTVVDGDFPRKVIARENLTFAPYKMLASLNTKIKYNARFLRAYSYYNRYGVYSENQGPRNTRPKRRALPPRKRSRVPAGLSSKNRYYKRIAQLANPKKANQAVRELVAGKKKALPYLLGEAVEGVDLARRGWSFVALAEMNDPSVYKRMQKIHSDSKQPMLVRTWAAAVLIGSLQSIKSLLKHNSLRAYFPATRRPFKLKADVLLRKKSNLSLEQMLDMSRQMRMFRASLAPQILAKGAKRLAYVMLEGKTVYTRRTAAAYLASLGYKPGQKLKVARVVIRLYRFRRKALAVPWYGGALYVPSIQWPQKEARELADQFFRWMVWAERFGKKGQYQQLHNNLRSLSLARFAGYRSPGWGKVTLQRWLQTWATVVGKKGIEEILKQQNLLGKPYFDGILQSIR